ncbi:MAG TPA: AtpZ/AtpI family protein [Anaerolineaceae bacterium]|nr:AtpZ/AtpI family protein [Anaerolineaceae bacterium]
MEEKEAPRIILPGQADPETRRKRLFSSRDLRATTIGWEIALPIVMGPLIGFFIDRSKGTGVRWTLILLGLGLFASVTSIVRYVSHEMHIMRRDEEAKRKEAEEKLKEEERRVVPRRYFDS